MTHVVETTRKLRVETFVVGGRLRAAPLPQGFNDVCLVRIPPGAKSMPSLEGMFRSFAQALGPTGILATLGDATDLVEVHTSVSPPLRYQLWIAIRRFSPKASVSGESLSSAHFGLLIHTRYKSSLDHAKTRVLYSYCGVCDRTTKDYGGKKHTYHESGTLLSDVWTDIGVDPEHDIGPVVDRLADLFALPGHEVLRVIEVSDSSRVQDRHTTLRVCSSELTADSALESRLIRGDVLDELKALPDNSVDFAFADPPYNLGKKYVGYQDDLDVCAYFEWCDAWTSELCRVLSPGRTCAILNIPLWAIRHFIHLRTHLDFQNWIVWDALSFPVRFIMPAHYSILCFSKGVPRPLPGMRANARDASEDALRPLAHGYCLRADCLRTRKALQIDDRTELTDLWSDIHRLKHNNRRVDHPCQLPPHLMYRLIALFTDKEEVVLDCFDGAGTTTLAAHQLGRRYVGIELSESYHRLALDRHREIDLGLDPFRKEDRVLSAKNSRVPRMPKQRYVVSKKTLQLEVRRVARELGRLPKREELKVLGKYPIEYYDRYFASWGEVCAAARTTGMAERRTDRTTTPADLQLGIRFKD